jgi:hypothetical protein
LKGQQFGEFGAMSDDETIVVVYSVLADAVKCKKELEASGRSEVTLDIAVDQIQLHLSVSGAAK